MKWTIKFLFGVAILLYIQACDKIEAPFRENINTVSGTNDSTIVISGDTIVFPYDNSTTMKKVLVEDFTGHLCGNCPYAGLLLNDTLRGIYGDKFVVISVHIGFYAHPCPGSAPCPGSSAPVGSFTRDFRDTIGDAWEALFAISSVGNPNGMVDRIDFQSGQHVKGPDLWSSLIQSQSMIPADFKLRIINQYDSTTRELKTALQTTVLNNKSGDYKLQLVLVEDSIVDWQEWYLPHLPPFDSTYVHRDVLRKGINSSFGQVVFSGAVTAGTISLEGFTYTINANFDAANCKVVAFIYDSSNYGVLQVEEKRVIE